MDNREYYRVFEELPETAAAKHKSPETVVRQAAQAAGLEVLKPWAVEKVAALRRRHRWTREDAETAYRILEAYYWERFIEHHPIRGRLMWFLAKLMRLRYPKALSLEPDEVVMVTPWRTDCPMVAGCKGDLERCRRFCDACFAHSIAIPPDEMAVLRASGPRVNLVLYRFRDGARDLCHYAIVSDGGE